MALKLPRLLSNLQIVASDFKPLVSFTRLWNDFCLAIEKNANDTAQAVADLAAAFAAIQAVSEVAQAAQQAANAAQETADDAGGGTVTSGSSSTAVTISSAAWSNGPQVDLTGVVAGDLTISGSGPQQDFTVSTLGSTVNGSYRVVEIVGMVETTLFTGDLTVYPGSPATVVNSSASAVSAFTSARASTGAVSYRMDAQTTSAGTIFDLSLYLFARRA